jgi:endogenous inhibitor of DNA gyrase (YacG/DUF329 family)
MSKCISIRGEYSEHVLTDEKDPYCCQRCWVVDDDAMYAEIERLRADRDQRDREQRAAALREAADDYPWRDAGGLTDAPGGAKHWLRERANQVEADQ